MLLFLKVFFTEFIAEMGDKTQLMLIALTSKYKLKDIIMGTAAAILVLNGLAVLAGLRLLQLLPSFILQHRRLHETRMKRKKRAERARSNLLLWQCSVRSL